MSRQLCVQHSGTISRPLPRPGPRIFCGAAVRARARSAVPQWCGKRPGIGTIDGLLPSRGSCRDLRRPSHGSRAAGCFVWWLFVRCGRVHLQLPKHLPALQEAEGSSHKIDFQARNCEVKIHFIFNLTFCLLNQCVFLSYSGQKVDEKSVELKLCARTGRDIERDEKNSIK